MGYTQTQRREFFTEGDVERLEKSLSILANIFEALDWEFVGMSELIVNGLLDGVSKDVRK